jgi:hypothetical protein
MAGYIARLNAVKSAGTGNTACCALPFFPDFMDKIT